MNVDFDLNTTNRLYREVDKYIKAHQLEPSEAPYLVTVKLYDAEVHLTVQIFSETDFTIL